MNRLSDFFTQRLKRGLVRRFNNLKIASVARQVAKREPVPNGQPIAFFKASTGIDDLSWNSGFHLLTAWALRLQGIPVAYFACNAGLSKCVLGTNRDNPHKEMPCKSCMMQSRALYAGLPSKVEGQKSGVQWFDFDRDPQLASRISQLSLSELMEFEWPLTPVIASPKGEAISSPERGLLRREERPPRNEAIMIPLGALCLPGLRWILRIHHLDDDEPTCYLLREYILSAWNVARKFADFLDQTQPRAVVIFNGQFFPEATAAFVARQHGLRVITHEVGLQPASAFFTDGEATIYPIAIPDSFEMSDAQNAKLDAYLVKRFQGDFTMAGIKFWADMKGLDEAFFAKASGFKQIVPIFTNVIFDTSQPHANTVFEDMFDWLDMALDVIRQHPETLFVIRTHPDETRVRKSSRETVEDWVTGREVQKEANVIFVGPRETLSSYELIQRSKFVMIYNSTIGLEASIMGAAVLCAGRARFTQYPTVFFPQTVGEVRSKMKEFLDAEKIEVPAAFKRNARRFLYYQLFRTSLPFGDFLEPSVRTSQTRLKSFNLNTLLESNTVAVILEGLLDDGDFLLKEPADGSQESPLKA